MELNDAILHARQVAEGCASDNRDCAYQHDQLADWLDELKAYRALGPIDHLRELVQAEQDGRLVVLHSPRLPLIWGDDNHDTILCPNCKHDLMGGFLMEGSYETHMYQCPYCGQLIDETKALTRKEAEAALKGETKDV